METPSIELIKRQFFQMVPIRLFNWGIGDSKELSSFYAKPEVQDEFYEKIINDAIFTKFPCSPNYTLNFFKAYIKILESQQENEISENILEYYLQLMMETKRVSGPPTEACFKTYYLDENCNSWITIKEDQRLISQGTTGLRTWEASLNIAEYFKSHPETIQNKSVLELGSGVGFLGLYCSHAGAKQVIMTDYSEHVLTGLENNIRLNCQQCPNASSSRLSWEDLEESEVANHQFDLVIGTDVTYDAAIIPVLVRVFKHFLVRGSEVILAATIRNQQTFDQLGISTDEEGIKVENLPLCQEGQFFYREEIAQVVILKLSLEASQ
ncbi:hypothetical protein K7432_005193 [Basidiobolus ranarum]|uniref:FAM86 N-terminal domain-containing protein n=1 Tax=Basidiobolus ranarum TaxID=34480 RepID=A0ABR2WWX1_9FUNG